MKHIAIVIVAAVALLASAGCEDDGTTPRPKPKETDGFKNLTEVWHTIHNLELAFDSKNADRYAEVFDPDNFVYFFDPDVTGGGVPMQWGYELEMQWARNLFNGVQGSGGVSFDTLDATFYDVEDVQWIAHESDDFPGETLLEVLLAYELMLETGSGARFETPGLLLSRFIAREIDGKWKLVRWYDEGKPDLVRVPSRD